MAVGMIVAVLIVFLFAALALDVGFWYFDHRSAQNQAEAAVQAAVLELPGDTGAAKDEAQAALGRNHVSATLTESNCDGMTGTTTGARILFPDNNTVRVCLRRKSLRLFSNFFLGSLNPYVSASATARATVVVVPYPLVVLDPSADHALRANANDTRVNVVGGGAYVDSSSSHAIFVNGNGATMTAQSYHVHGPSPGWEGIGTLTGTMLTNEPVLPDPYQDLPNQVWTGSCATTPDTTNRTLSPGCYGSLVTIPNNQTYTMPAGKYFFKQGMQINGTLTSNGAEVLMVFGCNGAGTTACNGNAPATNSTTCPGPAALNVNGTINIKGATTLGGTNFRHIAVWVDRTAKRTCTDVSLQGNTTTSVQGSIYGRNSTVSLQGSGNVTVNLNLSIVADQISFAGNSLFTLTWDMLTAPSKIDRAIID